ncbi:SWIB/MDM2 domain-containing protein [Chlamydia vaughanii]|uniref:SWIB/MDM2 domain-containing protein n=1 Tax=Chlamydia vaughanii TaxID=3112552 RepID=UPI0032B1B0F2
MSQKNKNSAFMNPVNISSDLAAIVGKGPMPRTEIVKKVWEYIKKHKLQDPKNKRNILPDANLAKVFGSTSAIDMFQMTKALSKHIIK